MTIKQRQHLLAYLGYYAGSVDGIWGKQSQEATASFQMDHDLTADGLFGKKTAERILMVIASGESERENFWGNILHFSPEEFRCKCGGKYCSGYPAQMKRQVVEICDAARVHFGAPALVVSGLRCREWNRIQGGVENSQHMNGEAVDLKIPGISAAELLQFLKTQPIRYAYAINDTNVHFDIEKEVY